MNALTPIPRRPAFLLCLVMVAALLPAVAASRPAHAALPEEFDRTTVVSGLDTPTAFRFAPDGRILIAEKDGAIRLVKNGVLQPTPMITVPANGGDERGLLGLELDPDFADNGYVYLAYTHSDNLDRLSRFTVVGDAIAPSSEQVLLQSDQQSNVYHHGGEVRFGPDGKLYWALGINLFNPNARNLGTIHGKILRINPDGTIPPDNPFADTPGAQPAIWAYGLRNPFRFTMVPNGPNAGKPLVGDVGGALHEEINLIDKGADYGWPEAEGPCAGCPFAQPVFSYPHTPPPASAGSISGVAVYTGDTFPEEYANAVFYADYTLGFIRYLTMDPKYRTVISDNVFDPEAGTPVQLEVGPDGNLYQLNIYPGELSRIAPAGGNRSPVAKATATPDNGSAPLEVRLSSAGSRDPDDDPITYLWDFADGTTSTEPNPVHTFTEDGTYQVTLTVSDGAKQATATVPVAVGNHRPTATIDTPAADTRYDAGDTISFSGTGTDPEDRELPDSAFSWTVVFHHADHVHPFLGPIEGVRSGTFTVPRIPDNVSTTWYRIHLTVTDSGGLQHTSWVDVTPNLVELTFKADPPGAKYTIDGIPHTGTYTETAVVGVERVLDAPSPQMVGSSQYVFAGWSDGGARSHTITTPSADTTYEVEFTEQTPPPAPWTSTDIGPRTIAGQTLYADGTFTVTGGGADIWGADDEFRYVHRPLSGDGSIVARVTSQGATDPWTKSGIMIKESAAHRAKYAAVMVTPAHGMHFQYGFTGDTGEHPYTFPDAWMKLTRTGSLFVAYRSTDGVNWTEIGRTDLTMQTDVTVGLFVNAHSDTLLNTTTFDNVTVTGGPAPGPGPWISEDVGDPDLPGSSSESDGVHTVSGAGHDVWMEQDQFRFVHRALEGDGTVIARVVSQQDTDPWAKAGIMIKSAATAGAPYAALMVTPGHGVHLQGTGPQSIAGTGGGPWLKLVRRGGTFSGYASPDGHTWSFVGAITVAVAAQARAGLFVTSHNSLVMNTSTFGNVSVAAKRPPGLPAGWDHADIGSPGLPGTAGASGRTFTLEGGGTDIWGDADQFHYAYRALDGDGTIVAQVISQEDTDPWAKAGIMIKSAAVAGSPYVAVMTTPGHGVHVQSGFTSDTDGGPAALPVWLRLTRTGTTVTAYRSADGSTWTPVATRELAGPATIGLFVTSHNHARLGTVVFDGVTVS